MPFDRRGRLKRPGGGSQVKLSREQVRQSIRGAFPNIRSKDER